MQERRRSWSVVLAWTSCRVQASFHAPSIALEWAATASSAMAASTGCKRNVVGSSAWQRTLITDVHGARELHAPWIGRPQREVQVGPDKLEVIAWFCYIGDMLSAAGGCELSTTACVKTAWKKFKELLPVLSSRQDTWPCVQLVCGMQCSMPVRLGHWQSQTSNVCSEMTGQWSDRSAMSSPKILSPPVPMSYLHGLALRIWTSFWRREGPAGIDMWNAPMVQSKQPLTYSLLESVGLGGPRWHGSSWQTEHRKWKLTAIDPHDRQPGDLVWDLPCVQQPATWKGAHWCGCCPCAYTFIKNPMMMMMMMVEVRVDTNVDGLTDKLMDGKPDSYIAPC